MCTIALALSVGATMLQGVMANDAARQQAETARQQAEYNAQIMEQNAAQARQDAEAVSAQERDEDKRLRNRINAVKGAQRAAAGASGLSLASESPWDLELDTVQQGEEDLGMLRKHFARDRFKLINEAVQYNNRAMAERIAGSNQASALKTGGRNALIGSALSSASLVAGKWDSIFSTSKAAAAGPPIRYGGANPWIGEIRWKDKFN